MATVTVTIDGKAYRMACDHADLIAGIASLAGATFDDPSSCQPSEPVHILQIHGTSDGVIAYGGGSVNATFPGAVETIETWGTYNGHTGRAADPGVAPDRPIVDGQDPAAHCRLH